jgi:hypothetical protein
MILVIFINPNTTKINIFNKRWKFDLEIKEISDEDSEELL